MKKIFGQWFGIMLIMVLFTGCVGGNNVNIEESQTENVVESDVNVDEIMDKTPEDFAGNEQLVVLGTNEDGKENFFVYAEGVVQALSANGENIVISADSERGEYVVKNPSEEIRNLKKGDIFVIPSTSESPLAASVKIESVQEEAEDIFVYKSQTIGVEEVYDYAYIETPVMAYSMWSNGDPAEGETAVELFGYTSDPSERVELSTNSTVGGFFDEKTEWNGTLKVGASLNRGVDVNLGSGVRHGFPQDFHYKQNMSMTLTEITAEFYHNPARGYLHIGLVFHTETSVESSWAYEGSWRGGVNGMGWTYPLAAGIIPYTVVPFTFEAFANAEISGGISGISYSKQGYVNRVGFEVFYYSNGDCYAYSDMTHSTETLNAELTGTVEGYVGFRLNVGIPNHMALYGEVGVLGLHLEGTLAKELESDDTIPESIHDCERCVDGELAIFGLRGRIGYVAALFGEAATSGHVDLSELEFKSKAFYASLGEEGTKDFEFGWGECPHRRYRALITVLNEEAQRTEGAQVIAKYPDMRTDQGETDEDGEVTLYLPNGDNLVGAKYMGQSGSTHVSVNEKPVTAVINMEDNGTLYINYAYNEQGNDTDNYPELRQQLEMMFPDAIFVSGDSVWDLIMADTIAPGDIVLDVKYGAPESSYGKWLDDDLSDGDFSGVWGESGGWIYIEGRRVFMYENEIRDSHCYFSFGITYEGPYEARLANPKPISANAFWVSVDCDISPSYDDSFKLIGYGDESTGILFRTSDRITLSHPYSTDVNSIYSIPSQRNMIVQEVFRLQTLVECMMDGADLRQEYPTY